MHPSTTWKFVVASNIAEEITHVGIHGNLWAIATHKPTGNRLAAYTLGDNFHLIYAPAAGDMEGSGTAWMIGTPLAGNDPSMYCPVGADYSEMSARWNDLIEYHVTEVEKEYHSWFCIQPEGYQPGDHTNPVENIDTFQGSQDDNEDSSDEADVPSQGVEPSGTDADA